MKQRVAYLEIDGKRFGDNQRGLNVTFDVPYTGTGIVPNNASFTITNLNRQDMYEIVTNTARFIERRRNIKCFAGYADNVKQIFGGQIFQSNPVDIPDTTVHISAISNILDMGNHIMNKSFVDIKFYDLIVDAATECGYKDLYISEGVRQSQILQTSAGKNWSCTGSAFEYLRRVEEDLAIQVNQAQDALAFIVANDVLYVGWQNEPYPASIPVISAKSGLIGIPTPTEAGINLQVLMDVSLSPLQTIYVQSEHLPLYNGKYNIINIRHHGSLRGRDWYSDLECVKVV